MSTQPVPTFPKLALFPEFEGKPVDTIIQDLLDKVIDDTFNADDWEVSDNEYDPEFREFFIKIMKNDPATEPLALDSKVEVLDYLDRNYVYNDSLSLEDRTKFHFLNLSIIQSL